MKTWRAILVCVILLRISSSCTRDKASADSCPGCPTTVSFKADILPIFQANCAIGGCHTPPTNAGGLNLDSTNAYATATDPGTGNVDTAYPKSSVLWLAVQQGGSTGMPLNAAPLPPCQVQEIYCWIEQGAHNN